MFSAVVATCQPSCSLSKLTTDRSTINSMQPPFSKATCSSFFQHIC